MIYGIGCDILNTKRIEKIYLYFKDKLTSRILTKTELLQAPSAVSQQRNFMLYLAKRYAAKEAFVKALGTGIGKLIGFQNIEILRNSAGKPLIYSPILYSQGLKAHISISDDPPVVIAYVILEVVKTSQKEINNFYY